MKNQITFLILSLLFIACKQEPQVKLVPSKDSKSVSSPILDKLNFVQGKWSGKLVYLDYGDNKSRTELPTIMTSVRKDDKILTTYIFTEPNGRKVNDSAEIFYSERDGLFLGGAYNKIESQSDKEWVLMRRGKDNNKSADIRTTISRDQESMSIVKEIKYDDAEMFIERNRYDFTKI